MELHSINIIFVNETHMKKLPSETIITFIFFQNVLSNIRHCVINFTKANLDDQSFFLSAFHTFYCDKKWEKVINYLFKKAGKFL